MVFVVFCLYHCIANIALLRITDINTHFNYFVGSSQIFKMVCVEKMVKTAKRG